TQVAEAVRVGPGTMPVFGLRTITGQELNSLVRYVEYLKAPDSRGGADLGLSGPIIEGFVALILGLGAMVLVTRYVGERA
ncbi:MAG TPA: cytochrome C, partial [Actinomycetota bacterium]|nr:cytochrome C [Actinomycetota bacterium]